MGFRESSRASFFRWVFGWVLGTHSGAAAARTVVFTRAVGLAAALAMMGEPTRKADMVLEWVVGVEDVRCDVALS